ncbi:MAG: hypothetical protein DMF04_09345 [Verrucomicrobia bacterium]|nr:MAG: hypothetical protein DMF04_09345 [Verrucomicrobiota bacterium]
MATIKSCQRTNRIHEKISCCTAQAVANASGSTRVCRAGESAPLFLEFIGTGRKNSFRAAKIRALAFARETRALGWRCNTKREIERIVQDFLFPSC